MRPNEQTANVDTQAFSHKEQLMSISLTHNETVNYLKTNSLKEETVRAVLADNGHHPDDHVDVFEFARALATIDRLTVIADAHPVTHETRAGLQSEIQIADEKILAAKTKPTKDKWRDIRNDLNARLNEIPSVALAKAEEYDRFREQDLLSALRKMVADGEKVRADMAENLTNSVLSALSALEWQDSKLEAMVAEQLARKALSLIDENGWKVSEAVANVLEVVEKRLLNNHHKGSSTGQGFRVVEAAHREAYANFRSKVSWYLG